MSKPKYRVLKNPKDDPQRTQLYEAENTFRRKSRYDLGMSAPQARLMIKEVRKLYGIKAPVALHFVRDAGWWGMLMQYHWSFGYAIPPFTIFVNGRRELDQPSVLHELAHLVDAIYHGPERQSHGPTFCGIASWLYDHFHVIPIDAYQTILRRYGVRFRRAEECSPRALIGSHKRKARR